MSYNMSILSNLNFMCQENWHKTILQNEVVLIRKETASKSHNQKQGWEMDGVGLEVEKH